MANFLVGLRYTLPFVDSILYWLSYDGICLEWMLVGGIIGIVTAIAQVWLIQQRYGFAPRFWYGLTIISWVTSGFILSFSAASLYPDSHSYAIFSWLSVPIFFQTLALIKHFGKGVLLWILAGIAVGIISLITYKSAPDYSEITFAFVWGSLAQTFLPAMAFMYLMARQRKYNIRKEALAVN